MSAAESGAAGRTIAMSSHERPVFPRGYRCASRNCGLKPAGYDLSLFCSEVPAAAAAVFTRNRFPGAPVIVGRDLIQRGRLRAVVVNSKVSNVGTGETGILNARRMGIAASVELGIPADEVLMLQRQEFEIQALHRWYPRSLFEVGSQSIETMSRLAARLLNEY